MSRNEKTSCPVCEEAMRALASATNAPEAAYEEVDRSVRATLMEHPEHDPEEVISR